MNYKEKDILGMSLNEEGTLCVLSMECGARIYNLEPLVGKTTLDITQIGSVSMCKLLHRTNLIAVVPGGSRAKYAENAVLIWDDLIKKFVLEFTFEQKVLNIRTRRDRLFVVEQHCIHCFSFPRRPQKLFTIDTRSNPRGIIEITPFTCATEIQLLAYPGHRVGNVQLIDLSTTTITQMEGDEVVSETSASVSISPTSVSAHNSEIAYIAFNRNGTLMATASGKGTLIRIFQTTNMDGPGSNCNGHLVPLSPVKVAEFRRGIDQALIYCIAFSHDSEYLLTSSDKGTVHIFALKDTCLNRRAKVPLVNIQVSPHSFSKFTLPAECASVCTFGSDNHSVYAVCLDGSFHKYVFNSEGSTLRDNYDMLLSVPDEDDYFFM